jgi:hypothetical protein
MAKRGYYMRARWRRNRYSRTLTDMVITSIRYMDGNWTIYGRACS